MSRAPLPKIGRTPLIALVEKAARALQRDMVRRANQGGYPEVKQAHNAVFATLPESGARATDMAERAGITRQSMGEIIRDMADLGIVEMSPDPDDRRAKLVTFTSYGRGMARQGYGRILELEQRFAEEFGEKEYEIVRDFLERLPAMLGDEA
ncbi:MAG: MarR family winged helix-turn-helix transcriptional regulator [Actinomycetota bacterium]|nr:MarR family winged helix-turn-helix transcriptional regulator [Actinomycetota bacterium]